MKTKMTAVDVRASVEEMKTLIGHRLLNVYDIGPKFLLLKFGHGDVKTTVLVENGLRMHVTRLQREKPKMPSQFTFKLRKHIKKWRLDHVRQLTGDRTIVLKFGTDETFFLLIVELYGRGNVILTDHNNVILMLLRTQKEGDVTLAVKGTYPLEPERAARTPGAFLQAADEHFKACDPSMSINKALTTFDNLGPQLAEHVIASAPNITATTKVGQLTAPPSSEDSPLHAGILEAFELLEGQWRCPGGALVTAASTGPSDTAAPGPAKYVDFAPLVLRQFDATRCERRESFGDTCDLYFLRSEMDKIDQHNDKKEAATVTAKERFLKEHNRRLEKLQSEEDLNIKKGSMLEMNAESVQEVIDLMNMLLAMKLGWEKIRLLVKARQREGHPVAYMIHDVNLERNSVTVLLEDDLEDEEEDQDIEPFAVEVDLSMNAQRNASKYFTVKKKVHQKLEKTVAATDKATASAERKGQRVSAKQGAVKKEVVEQRKTFWYEKFFWFLTTLGDLAVYARDQTQTDTLLRKYMCPSDIFVHCDAARAPVCVLKAMSADKRMAMDSILEAGSMCVSRSAAWDSKTSMSAWWVSASAVAPMQQGAYSVSGERNYLKPMPLATAVVALFRTKAEQAPVVLDVEAQCVNTLDIVVEPKEPQTPQASAIQAANDFGSREHSDDIEQKLDDVEAPVATKRAGISIRSLTQRTAAAGREEDVKSSTSTAVDDSNGVSRRTLHKLKKIKKKYGEQDDDEREERMRLLGNCPSKVHKLAPDALVSEPALPPPPQPQPDAAVRAAPVKVQRSAAPVDSEKYATQIAEGAEELRYFSQKPETSDDVLYAVCLCVPSSVAVNSLHRSHITYGQEKKGSAATSIIKHFSSTAAGNVSIATALRFVEVEQLTNQLPSNIKVHFAQSKPTTGNRVTSHHTDPKGASN